MGGNGQGVPVGVGVVEPSGRGGGGEFGDEIGGGEENYQNEDGGEESFWMFDVRFKIHDLRFKFQITNYKLQTISNIQIPISKRLQIANIRHHSIDLVMIEDKMFLNCLLSSISLSILSRRFGFASSISSSQKVVSLASFREILSRCMKSFLPRESLASL